MEKKPKYETGTYIMKYGFSNNTKIEIFNITKTCYEFKYVKTGGSDILEFWEFESKFSLVEKLESNLIDLLTKATQ